MPDSTDDLQRQLLKTFQVEAQEHLQKLNETDIAASIRPRAKATGRPGR